MIQLDLPSVYPCNVRDCSLFMAEGAGVQSGGGGGGGGGGVKIFIFSENGGVFF